MSGPVSMRRGALVLALLAVGCTCGERPASTDAGAGADPVAVPDPRVQAAAPPADPTPQPSGFVDTDVDNHVIARLLGGGSGDFDLSAGDVESAVGYTPTNVNAQAVAFEAQLKAELAALKAEVLPELPSPTPAPAPTMPQVPVGAGSPAPDTRPVPPPAP